MNRSPVERISYSAIQDSRQCEQRYHYGYVERLRSKVDAAPPALGRVLHTYLEYYYQNLKDGKRPKKAHKAAMDKTELEREDLKQLAWAASVAGESEIGKELAAVLDFGLQLAETYYKVRGHDDADAHEILMVEEKIEIPLWEKGPILPGRVDLVTRNEHGNIVIWEHKSTTSVPRQGRRLRDLQTNIYHAAIEEIYNVTINQVIWNYLHTAPLVAPILLKGRKEPTLSTKQHMSCTVEMYELAIAENGLDKLEYEAYLEHLALREKETMFPRYELPILGVETILLRDVIRTAEDIRTRYARSDFIPVKNITANCDWCPFVKLCEAEILGGDVEDVKRQRFKIQEIPYHGKKSKRKTATESEDDERIESGLLADLIS